MPRPDAKSTVTVSLSGLQLRSSWKRQRRLQCADTTRLRFFTGKASSLSEMMPVLKEVIGSEGLELEAHQPEAQCHGYIGGCRLRLYVAAKPSSC